MVPVLAFSSLSHAEDALHSFKSVFVGGASFSGKTDYTIYESDGTNLGTTTDRANAAADFAGEITYQSPFILGVGFLVEGTRYEYQTSGSDGELALYAMPRLAHSFGPLEIWAGVGLGMMINRVGGPSSEVQNGVTFAFTNMNSTSFAWSPRVGADFDITSRIFIGAQVSYTKTTFSIPYTATGATTFDGTVNTSRSWLGGALRVGSKF